MEMGRQAWISTQLRQIAMDTAGRYAQHIQLRFQAQGRLGQKTIRQDRPDGIGRHIQPPGQGMQMRLILAVDDHETLARLENRRHAGFTDGRNGLGQMIGRGQQGAVDPQARPAQAPAHPRFEKWCEQCPTRLAP